MEDSKEFGKIFDSLPLEVVYHLKKLIKSTGFIDNSRNFNRFMESWLAKRGQFDKIVEQGSYAKVTSFKVDNPNSCIAMTISGSLVTLGPLIDGSRTGTYTSIGVRTDVPMVKIRDKSVLESDIELHKSLVFSNGPIKSTSIILDIAVLSPVIDDEEQIKELSSANDLLLNKFLSINRDFLSDKYKDTDLINRNDLFEKWIILKWFKIGGMEEYIFLARAKLLWLELFLKFYELLSEKDFSPGKRDELFLDLTNQKFVKFLDVYKWFDSDKKDFDIGILNAMEDIPDLDSYLEFGDNFYKEYE